MAKSIDSGVIRSTASQIRNLNNQLESTLNSSKSSVNSLKGQWTGQAADATIGAFNSFAAKYFEEYKEMLNGYVNFLNNAAGSGYEETEKLNTDKSSQI